MLSIGKNSVRRVRENLAPIEVSGTARQTYNAMLDQQIAPQLREWGFTGEAGVYEYPSDTWFLRLAFVPASWNTVTRFQFDVNVIAVPKQAWSQWRGNESSLPETPDPAMYYAHDFRANDGLKSRLGEFRRNGTDVRWTVYDDQDPTAVAADVLARIKRKVVPEFTSRAELQDKIA